MAGAMVANPAVPVSNLTQQIEAGSNRGAATRCAAAAVSDRHQNGARSAAHSGLAATFAGRLAESLAVFGLDVCEPFNLSWYGFHTPFPRLRASGFKAALMIPKHKIDLGSRRTCQVTAPRNVAEGPYLGLSAGQRGSRSVLLRRY
jgi:hypothetical protein